MRRKPHPKQECTFVHETWGPHPGCAEFMTKPEIWVCRDPATHVVKYTDYYDGLTKMKVCNFHAKYVTKSDFGFVVADSEIRVYRYRTV